MFHKSNIKFVIDGLMFLCMAALAGIGFLTKYVLLPGKEAQVKYGTKVELSFLGLDKHEWGTIHLITGFVLIGLLVLHIFLNWKQIVNMYQRLIGSQISRKIITAVFLIACVFLVILPFIASPEVQEKAGGGRGGHSLTLGTEETIHTPTSSLEMYPYTESLDVDHSGLAVAIRKFLL